MEPATGERLIAHAEVLRSGRSLTTCEVKVFASSGREENLCAVALVTLWPQQLI
jgi:acyl-coenzyme A thioesterase PaaI-like protein